MRRGAEHRLDFSLVLRIAKRVREIREINASGRDGQDMLRIFRMYDEDQSKHHPIHTPPTRFMTFVICLVKHQTSADRSTYV
eukprot:1640473-Amphidinium_carterae.1